MHSPRPYGLLVVNGKLSEQDRLFIDHQLKKLSNQKALSNLDSIRQVRDLPDGGYVILQDMAGILKAIAHKELDPYAFENDGLAKLYVPMLFSGVITKARVLQNEGVGIKLTEQCRQRLSDYKNNDIPNKENYNLGLSYMDKYSYGITLPAYKNYLINNERRVVNKIWIIV